MPVDIAINPTEHFSFDSYTTYLANVQSFKPTSHSLSGELKSSNVEEELQKIKDIYSQLKFNYLELETKQKFLECIIEDDITPSDNDVSSVDASVKEKKRLVKEAREHNACLSAKILAAISELTNLERESLASQQELLQKVQEVKDVLESNFPEQSTRKRKAQEREAQTSPLLGGTIDPSQPYNCSISKHDAFINSFHKLSGVEVQAADYEAGSVTLLMERGAILTIFFHNESNMNSIKNATLFSPIGVIPCEDIVRHAKDIRSVPFLVREVNRRVHNDAHIRSEIDSLLSAGVLVEWVNRADQILTVEFAATGHMAGIKLDLDYPAEAARARVTSLEHFEQSTEVLNPIVKQINKDKVICLTDLLRLLEEECTSTMGKNRA